MGKSQTREVKDFLDKIKNQMVDSLSEVETDKILALETSEEFQELEADIEADLYRLLGLYINLKREVKNGQK